jgi:hypothetical protein
MNTKRNQIKVKMDINARNLKQVPMEHMFGLEKRN